MLFIIKKKIINENILKNYNFIKYIYIVFFF